MNKHIRILLVMLCCHNAFLSYAQQYTGVDYNSRNGLLVESIKWVEQDTAGYIWLATDDGIVRFDGVEFKHYNRTTKPFVSEYFKQIFQLKNGKILAAGYRGMYEIVNKPDTTYFRLFPDSASNAGSALDEVKKIYESSDGTIWLGERKTITRLNNNTVKTYNLGDKNFSNDYFRSFQFFEFHDHLYVVSYNGYIYRYNPQTDNFDELACMDTKKSIQISAVCVTDKNILVGTGSSTPYSGIYELIFTSPTEVTVRFRLHAIKISHLLYDQQSKKILVSFWLGNMAMYDINNNTIVPLQGFNNIKVYNFIQLNDETICIATEKGILLRNRVLMGQVKGSVSNYYVNAITSDNNDNTWVTSEAVHKIDTKSDIYTSREIYYKNNTFSRAITVNNQYVWFSQRNISPKVGRILDNKVVFFETDHPQDDITFMQAAQDGSVWICHQTSDTITRLMPDGRFRYYGKNEGVVSKCMVIKQYAADSTIVAGGTGEHYLLRYNPATDKFEDISKPYNQRTNQLITVTDMAFDSKGTIFIAAKGVLRVDSDSSRLISEQHASLLFNSIAIDQHNQVYAAADVLYKFANGNIYTFGTDDGLLARPSYGCLHVDKQNRLWIGNAVGLNVIEFRTPKETTTPFVFSVESEGRIQKYNASLISLIAGTYLLLRVKNMSFPHQMVRFEYRIRGKQSLWQPCTKHNEIFVPELEAGGLTIEIRALKQGNFEYSDVNTYTFTVLRPWYLRWWFILLVVLVLAAFIWAFIKVNNKRLLHQKYRLEQIVKERTAEVVKQTEAMQLMTSQLQLANEELSKLSLVASETDSAVIICDAMGHFEWANPAYEKVYGFTLEYFKQHYGDNVLNLGDNEIKQKMIDSIKNKEPISYNFYDDISQKWMQGNFTPVYDNNGNLSKIIIIDVNIDSLVRTENKLKEKNIELSNQKEELAQTLKIVNTQKEELQKNLHTLQTTQKKLVESEKMASLGNLVAGVAHEINTPVGVAITSISTVINDIKELVAKYENGDMAAKDFETYVQMFYDGNALALKNLERTAHLVRSFKQISLDQHSEQERKFNLNDYLHDILASINPEFKHTQIKISIDCPNDLVINSYPGTFAQIFTNLLTNSKRHGFRNRNEGQINIVVKRENDKLHMEYTDNGHGIAATVLPRIFDPFFTTDMQAGTGLGLNILYNLVTQKLGGEIRCESKEGEGVKFLMTL